MARDSWNLPYHAGDAVPDFRRRASEHGERTTQAVALNIALPTAILFILLGSPTALLQLYRTRDEWCSVGSERRRDESYAGVTREYDGKRKEREMIYPHG